MATRNMNLSKDGLSKVKNVMREIGWQPTTYFFNPARAAFENDAWFYERGKTGGRIRDALLINLPEICIRHNITLRQEWLSTMDKAIRADKLREKFGEVEIGSGVRNSFGATLLAFEDAVMRAEGKEGHDPKMMQFYFETDKTRRAFASSVIYCIKKVVRQS